MKKVILCGYNLIGCEVLNILQEKGFQIFVYTHKAPYHIPDLTSFCEKLNIEYSHEKISIDNLPFKPDVICSIYYRYIISKEIIDFCHGKIFNLHPSLLPNYRGCSSITWALVNGEEHTGYTYHYISPQLDKGSIILQKRILINSYDTQESLYNKVMLESKSDFLNVLMFVIQGRKGLKQNDGGKYYKRGVPYGGKISSDWDIKKVERFIRAMIHPPYPLSTFNGYPIENLNDYLRLKNEK